MNMRLPLPPLGELKAEREKLRGRLEGIAKSKRTLAAADEALAAATQELADFEAFEAEAVTKWAASACKGTRPQSDVDRHAALAQRVKGGRRAVENTSGGLEHLAGQEAEMKAALGAVARQIENAAAREIANELAAKAERLKEIRAEAAELEEELRAAHAFAEGHRYNPQTGAYVSGNDYFDHLRKIPNDALGLSGMLRMSSRASIIAWREKLDFLMA